MKKRLTLTIDPEVLHRARRVANERHASLSSLVESLLDEASGAPSKAASSFSRRWRGKLKVEERDEPRYRRLAEKYGVDS